LDPLKIPKGPLMIQTFLQRCIASKVFGVLIAEHIKSPSGPFPIGFFGSTPFLHVVFCLLESTMKKFSPFLTQLAIVV